MHRRLHPLVRRVPVRKRAEDIAVPPEVFCLVLQRQAALANLVFVRLGVGHDGGLATNMVRVTCWTLLEHIPGSDSASDYSIPPGPELKSPPRSHFSQNLREFFLLSKSVSFVVGATVKFESF